MPNTTYSPVGDEYSAYPNEDKTGTPLDWETEIGFIIAHETIGGKYYFVGANQNKAVIRLRNYSTTKTAYFFNLKIAGAGLYEPGNSLTTTVEDAASIALNGAREMTISNRLIQTAEIADAVGAAMLAATSTRDTASVVTLGYDATGSEIVSALKNYELGMLMNFGTSGGATSRAKSAKTAARRADLIEGMRRLPGDGSESLTGRDPNQEPPAIPSPPHPHRRIALGHGERRSVTPPAWRRPWKPCRSPSPS